MRPFVLPFIALTALAAAAAQAQAPDPYNGYGTAQPPAGYGGNAGYGGYGGGDGYGYPPPGYGGQGYPPQGYYGDPGQAQGYGAPPAPPGGVSYQDDERWGSGDSYGSADARGGPDTDPSSGWRQPAQAGGTAALNAREAQRTAPPPPGDDRYSDMRRQDPRTAAYADRVARWRARADACEAGDVRACQGPGN